MGSPIYSVWPMNRLGVVPISLYRFDEEFAGTGRTPVEGLDYGEGSIFPVKMSLPEIHDWWMKPKKVTMSGWIADQTFERIGQPKAQTDLIFRVGFGGYDCFRIDTTAFKTDRFGALGGVIQDEHGQYWVDVGYGGAMGGTFRFGDDDIDTGKKVYFGGHQIPIWRSPDNDETPADIHIQVTESWFD